MREFTRPVTASTRQRESPRVSKRKGRGPGKTLSHDCDARRIDEVSRHALPSRSYRVTRTASQISSSNHLTPCAHDQSIAVVDHQFTRSEARPSRGTPSAHIAAPLPPTAVKATANG